MKGFLSFDDLDFENETVNIQAPDGEVIDKDFLMFFPMMGHYLDALFASEDTLRKKSNIFSQECIQAFNPPKYTAGQHRVIYGLFKLYNKKGLNVKTIKEGIFLTPYELCEAMEYKRNSKGMFNGKDQKEALKILWSLAYISIDIYRKQFDGYTKDKKKIYNVGVVAGEKILECAYQAKGVLEKDFGEETNVRKKVRKLWVRLNTLFFNSQYFKLSVSDFYTEITGILKENNKRITEYHWTFMLWLLKQNNQKVEINIDKLVKILKVYTANRNLPRARNYVRELYPEFREINYLLDYQIDVEAKSGGTKDILVINPEKFRSLKRRLQKSKEKAMGYSNN